MAKSKSKTLKNKKLHSKYSGKGPVMFYQPGFSGSIDYGPRVRVFYPNGKAEWASLENAYTYSQLEKWGYFFGRNPCYLMDNTKYRNKELSMFELIELAMEFDKENNFPKMEFLGEL